MKASTISLFICIIGLSGCTLSVSKASVTEAKLRRIDKILFWCESSGVKSDSLGCIHEYVKENLSPDVMDGIIRDAYGQEIILNVSERCSLISTRVPYSSGPNRIDECGGGDDISLR